MKLSIDEIKRRLQIKFGIEEDDLKSLKLTDEKEIRELYETYMQNAPKMREQDVLSGKGAVVEDNYNLSKDEAAEVATYQKGKKKQKTEIANFKKKVKKATDEVKQIINQAAVEEAGSHLPPEDRASFDEVQQALKDLKEIDFDEEE